MPFIKQYFYRDGIRQEKKPKAQRDLGFYDDYGGLIC